MLRPVSITAFLLLSLLPGRGDHLKDDFSQYPSAPLADGWPSLPGNPVWHIGSNGASQEIRIDSESGHSGPVFSYSEVSGGAHSTYSFTQLPSSFQGETPWHLTVEFYIDSLENPGVYGVVGLNSGTVSAKNALTSVAFSRNSVNGRIQTSVQTVEGSRFFRGYLEEKQWYRLHILKEAGSTTLDFKLEGNGYTQSLDNLPLATDNAQCDLLILGDMIPNQWQEGRHNVVFIRSIELSAPATP